MDTTGKVRLAVANLRAGVAMIQSGNDWQRALDVQARFHSYSFANCALIFWQRPDATRVAGFHAWKKLGRSVKKGEKGIQILAPAGLGRREVERDDGTTDERTWMRFRIVYVFDVSQTEGKPLPTFRRPMRLDDETFASSVDELRKVALALPGGVVGGIDVRRRRASDPCGAGGWYDLLTKAIVVVTDGASHAQQFKTLVHEIAHAILHPVGEHHAQPVREVEAESVAYVVCSALGLDSSSYSFPYVSHWASGADAAKLVQQSGERIAKTARTILEALEAHPPTGDDDSDRDAASDGDEAADTVRVPAMMFSVPSAPSAVAVHADRVTSGVSEAQDDAATLAAEKAARRASNAKRALEAASDLAERAEIDGEARALDTRVLFGSLLANAANKWIAFTVGGRAVTLTRAHLARCATVLKRRADLSAFVDADGLHFRWNGGLGGLNLYGGEVVERIYADRVLHVVFPLQPRYRAPATLAAGAALPTSPPENDATPIVLAPAVVSRPDEKAACGDAAACDRGAAAPCVRATTRWHRFQAMREIADVFAPAVERALVTQASRTALVTLDVAALERVRALYGGAAARDQEARLVATSARAASCSI